MSGAGREWAWSRSGVTPAQRVVLLALGDRHHDSDGQCRPSIEDLVRRTQLGERTVKQAITDLVRAGHIEIPGGRRGGRRITTRYLLVGLTTDPGNGANPAPFPAEKGADFVQKGADFVEKGAGPAPAPVAPDTPAETRARTRAPAAADQLILGAEYSPTTDVVAEILADRPELRGEPLERCLGKLRSWKDHASSRRPRAEWDEIARRWASMERAAPGTSSRPRPAPTRDDDYLRRRLQTLLAMPAHARELQLADDHEMRRFFEAEGGAEGVRRIDPMQVGDRFRDAQRALQA